MTLTAYQINKIKSTIDAMPELSVGIGTRESACSIAAINLALTGELTDKIPECMSAVIGDCIIALQDLMPKDIRNSLRWRSLLPLAAGTGREQEKERLDLILNWMWDNLKYAQPIANKYGFGEKWELMCEKRTEHTADVVSDIALRIFSVESPEKAAQYLVSAAGNASVAMCHASAHLNYASKAASKAGVFGGAKAWDKIDPCGLLEKLIHIEK